MSNKYIEERERYKRKERKIRKTEGGRRTYKFNTGINSFRNQLRYDSPKTENYSNGSVSALNPHEQVDM